MLALLMVGNYKVQKWDSLSLLGIQSFMKGGWKGGGPDDITTQSFL